MKNRVLETFMKDNFPFGELKKAGFFTKEMKGDYEAQSKRVCEFFGYKSVYEYGAKEIRLHLSPVHVDLFINNKGELASDPFITVIESLF